MRFTLLKEETTKINSHAIELEEPTKYHTFMIMSGIILVLIIIGLLMYIKKLKKV